MPFNQLIDVFYVENFLQFRLQIDDDCRRVDFVRKVFRWKDDLRERTWSRSHADDDQVVSGSLSTASVEPGIGDESVGDNKTVAPSLNNDACTGNQWSAVLEPVDSLEVAV